MHLRNNTLIVIVSCTLGVVIALPLWSQDYTTQRYSAAYSVYLSELTRAETPRQFAGRIIFTYAPGTSVGFAPHQVSIAFAHEAYRVLYRMHRNSHRVFFYTLDLQGVPYDTTHIEYRVVIDGVWGLDPNNSDYRIDDSGIKISRIKVSRAHRFSTSPIVSNREVQFVFNPHEEALIITETDGVRSHIESNQKLLVSVAGNFNGWDPYLNPLKAPEDLRTIYQTTLSLAPGRHYYYFVVNGRRILDPHNPSVVTSSKGHSVSVVTIE